MLQELGITQFAYDYRDEHLPSFPEEIELLKEKGLELKARGYRLQEMMRFVIKSELFLEK